MSELKQQPGDETDPDIGIGSAVGIDFKPDSASATPLYLQLANKIESAILQGIWQESAALPSERLLSQALDISRVTARKALDLLCERGLLTRKHGSGTFVSRISGPLHQEAPLSRLVRFSEQLQQRGFVPGMRWLSRETGVATPQEVLALGLSPGALVARLKRLRMADDVVVAIELTTIPQQYLPDPVAVLESVLGYLRGKGYAPVRALQHVRAVNASAEQARLAGIAPGTALLSINRTGFLDHGGAVEFTRCWCLSEYMDFVEELVQ